MVTVMMMMMMVMMMMTFCCISRQWPVPYLQEREDDCGEYYDYGEKDNDFVLNKQEVTCPMSQKEREDDDGEYDVDDFV